MQSISGKKKMRECLHHKEVEEVGAKDLIGQLVSSIIFSLSLSLSYTHTAVKDIPHVRFPNCI